MISACVSARVCVCGPACVWIAKRAVTTHLESTRCMCACVCECVRSCDLLTVELNVQIQAHGYRFGFSSSRGTAAYTWLVIHPTSRLKNYCMHAHILHTAQESIQQVSTRRSTCLIFPSRLRVAKHQEILVSSLSTPSTFLVSFSRQLSHKTRFRV